MTPEARERRRIRTPVLAVVALAWAAILLADPHGYAAAGGHSRHASMGAGSPPMTDNLLGLLLGWALMLTAMMGPLLIPALRHVRARSLRSRRWRAMALVVLAHAVVWTLGGIGLVVVAAVLWSVTGGASRALLLGIVVALLWQLSPAKQHCLNRHCAQPPLATFGAAADRAVLRFGGTHALWCLWSCAALMLLPLLAPRWQTAVMLLVSLWMWVEPLDRPERPTWRGRLPLRSVRISLAMLGSLLPVGQVATVVRSPTTRRTA